MAAPTRKRRLGKGLSSLLTKPVDVTPPDVDQRGQSKIASTIKPQEKPTTSVDTAEQQSLSTELNKGNGEVPIGSPEGGLVYILTEQIIPNPHQPRQVFDDDGISSLADSIETAGLMQPIVVRAIGDGDTFELVAGERRWRAAQVAGLQHMPALIRNLDDKTAAEWALIENLQREDLNPIDRAEAFDRLVVDFGVTHADIATQLGIDRSSVSNFLRLNDLESVAKDAVRDGRLSMGHAKVLLGIPDAGICKAIAKRCASEQWSVRELERQLKKRAAKKNTKHDGQEPLDMLMENLSTQLGEHLGTQVSITLGKKKGSGKISISFYDNEQFEGILETFNFKPTS